MEKKDKSIIAVLDSNKGMQHSIETHIMQDNTKKVVVFEDAKKCLQYASANKIDVLIMDLILPNIDGYEFLNLLKQHKLAKTPKIIILSALTSDQFVLKALSMGADYYMVKPCDMGLLEQRVNEFLLSNFAVGVQTMPQMQQINNNGFSNKKIEEKISNIFITVGIPAHIKGYQFLREAIKIVMDNPQIINHITKKLYPTIAERFDTSASKVERSIRHAIEVAWNRGKIENINALFGLRVYSNNEKPTNGEFIALVADKMLLEKSE